MKYIRYIIILLGSAVILINTSLAIAQNKVVVIPLGQSTDPQSLVTATAIIDYLPPL
jgi:hypothetical protein